MKIILQILLLLAAVTVLVITSDIDRKEFCKLGRVPYQITRKSILPNQPSFSVYSYSTNGWDYVESIDSTSKFEVGQFINK